MSVSTNSIYQQKLVSAETAAAVVKSGDKVFMGEFVQNIEAFDAALALRKNALRDVILVTTTRVKPLKCVEVDPAGSVRISVCEAVGLFSVTVRRPLTVLPVPAR